jgi:hypothetical protein
VLSVTAHSSTNVDKMTMTPRTAGEESEKSNGLLCDVRARNYGYLRRPDAFTSFDLLKIIKGSEDFVSIESKIHLNNPIRNCPYIFYVDHTVRVGRVSRHVKLSSPLRCVRHGKMVKQQRQERPQTLVSS